jgi:hypothetical protein
MVILNVKIFLGWGVLFLFSGIVHDFVGQPNYGIYLSSIANEAIVL